MTCDEAGTMKARLRADIRTAMQARDKIALGVLRQALSAIDNAEAVPAAGHEPAIGGHGDVARRELSYDEVTQILHAERHERAQAIAHYTDLGLTDVVDRLRAEAQVLDPYLQP